MTSISRKVARFVREKSFVTKLTYEEVKKRFEDLGYTLITTTYEGVRTRMECICKNGHSTLKSLRQLNRACQYCSAAKNADSLRMSYESVFKYFKDNDCLLLNDTYTSTHESLSYICVCGRVSKTTYTNFRKGVRCSECGLDKLANQFKHDISFIRQEFKKKGAILLSETYNNSKQKLEYICSCGKKSTTMYVNFMKGKSCVECGIKKNSGVNHPKYNPDLTDKIRKRHLIGYQKWRKEVFERDSFSCLKCFRSDDVELNAHHIKNFSQEIELAIEVDNGATLCKECHLQFHKEYGFQDNNEDQIIEWLCS